MLFLLSLNKHSDKTEKIMKTAANLTFGEMAIITGINSEHPSARRIIEIGFTPGQQIELINKTAFNDPLAFSVRGALIAIRKNEAESIYVI
ncbi:MAG: ferrous iron transport protein A [Ignavibacteriae bacterium HGW-Ignavibacteriae-2]|jgi:ferrous iron transport protein A|nr:MAG: ferrous iron transport protein A [Ignavibacteriae bacterium HGW-Ignavibacteriae-2]